MSKFVAIVSHRAYADAEGKGWPAVPLVRVFSPDATVGELWEWFDQNRQKGGGILEFAEWNDGEQEP